MATIILEHETNGYWNLIKDAGNEVKLALIKRLSDAVMPAVIEKKLRGNIRLMTSLESGAMKNLWMPKLW